MAEDMTTDEPGGQADATPDGATADASDGQSTGEQGAGTTEQTPAAAEDSFFDPNDVPDELKPAYKNMQASYTKKMQALSEHRNKIDAYDAFYSNPVENIRNVAKQYGIDLGGNDQGQPGPDFTDENYQPKSWQEVFNTAKDMAKSEVMQELSPFIQGMQQVRKESIESQLTQIDPAWQQYEDDMKANMDKHPSLAQDPALLYRISVPSEVLESRATQQALKRLEAKGQSAQVSGGSTTTKQTGSPLPDKAVSFTDAVKAAKAKLAEDGIAPSR